jgi:hypothetical protein
MNLVFHSSDSSSSGDVLLGLEEAEPSLQWLLRLQWLLGL